MNIKKYVFEKLKQINETVGFENILIAEDDDCIYDLSTFVEDCVEYTKAEYGKYGCSKCVFSFNKDDDFVIKIPFIGRYEYEYDDETDDYYDLDFIEFENAGYHLGFGFKHEWDYCKVEEKVYFEAKKRNLDNFFAKTTFLGNFLNHPIYISEKAKPKDKPSSVYTSDKSKRSAAELAVKYINHFSYHPPIDNLLVSEFIEIYGEDETYRFLSFLGELGLNDFHSGNIGYINDKAVIIDYSDYHD